MIGTGAKKDDPVGRALRRSRPCSWPSCPAASRPSFDDLVANLKSPNAGTRREAAAALGKSRRREAVTPLAALVRDPEAKVRLEVVRALRELRDLSAMPALVTSLGDGEPQIREEAIGTLVEIYSERERAGAGGQLPERLLRRVRPGLGSGPTRPWSPPSIRALAARPARRGQGDPRGGGLRPGHPRRAQRAAATCRQRLAGPGVLGARRRRHRDRQDRHGGGRQGPDPAAGRRRRRSAQRVLQAIGVLRVQRGRPGPARDVRSRTASKDQGVRVLACLSAHRRSRAGRPLPRARAGPESGAPAAGHRGPGPDLDASRLPAFKKDYQREKNDELRLAYSFALTLLGDRAFLDSIVLSLPSRTLGNAVPELPPRDGPVDPRPSSTPT